MRDGMPSKRGGHKRVRRFPNANRPRPDKYAGRVSDAAAHAVDYQKLTPKQHLGRLDIMFGPGLGAKRERARLQERIDRPELAEFES